MKSRQTIKHLYQMLCVILFFTVSQSVSANSLPDCTNPTGGYATGYCSEQEFKVADKQLNITYRQLTNKLDKDQKEILVVAQKAWLKVRDNDCEFEQYDNIGTTGWVNNLFECKTRKTNERTTLLKSFAKDLAFEENYER